VLDSNHFLEQQIEELTLNATHAHEARARAEQAKKNALDQLHVLRQEAEIQREDLRSAECETKKAWKVVVDANSKASAQVKELTEAQEAKLEVALQLAALQREMDQMAGCSKLGTVEKSRLESDIAILQRRVKMEQELTRRAEADLVAKTKEVSSVKRQDVEMTKSKIAVLTEQKEKMEIALRDWQSKHAELASRLDASETHKSRAVLEIEDLVCQRGDMLIRTTSLPDRNKLEPPPSVWRPT
jgi:chromosome segregation ATPase